MPFGPGTVSRSVARTEQPAQINRPPSAGSGRARVAKIEEDAEDEASRVGVDGLAAGSDVIDFEEFRPEDVGTTGKRVREEERRSGLGAGADGFEAAGVVVLGAHYLTTSTLVNRSPCTLRFCLYLPYCDTRPHQCRQTSGHLNRRPRGAAYMNHSGNMSDDTSFQTLAGSRIAPDGAICGNWRILSCQIRGVLLSR